MPKPYILVVRQLGGIGDVLGLSPVFRGLKEKHPDHKITCVTAEIYLGGSLMDIASHNPFIDDIVAIEPFQAAPERTRHVWNRQFGNSPPMEEELIWKRADIALDLNTACVESEWPAMQNGGICVPRYKVWCDAASVVPSSYKPVYKITRAEQSVAKAYRKEHWGNDKVVGVGLAAADKRRALGIRKLTEICRGLVKEGLRPVTIDTKQSIESFDCLIGKRVRDIIPLISQMQACISVDSGIMHMAGAVGIPIIGIFGPTDPEMRMGQYKGSATIGKRLVECAPCWYNYPCNTPSGNGHPPFDCMDRISAEVIIEETVRWVDKS